MRHLIIGAGRGSRLKALTDGQPKAYASVGDRRILDWLLESLGGTGMDTPVFIGGYQIDMIRTDYPQLSFCHNQDWPNNNILASLFCAEEHMSDGFVCTYADILYRSSVVQRALEHEADIVLCVDVDWRKRYFERSQHPEEDAEKVLADGDRVTRIDRQMPSAEARGEYIGVAKFSQTGAACLREHYHRVRREFAGRQWKGGTTFEKAYLIHLFEEMLDQSVSFHMVATDGEYMEIDTEEDYALANERWPREFGGIDH